MAKNDIWTAIYWGDYSRDTLGLSMRQHGAYFLLLRAYYTTGGALNDSNCYRFAMAFAIEEQQDVDMILQKYFTKTEGGLWIHARAEAEIRKQKKIKETRAAVGAEGVKKRWAAAKDSKAIANGIANGIASTKQTAKQNDTSHSHIKKEERENTRARALPSPRTPEKTPLPPDWVLPEGWQEDMRSRFILIGLPCPPPLIGETAEQFKAFMLREGRRSESWRGEWGYWIGNEIKRTQKAKAAGPPAGKRMSVTESHRQFLQELDREYSYLDEGGGGEARVEGGYGVCHAERLLADG